MSPNTLRWRNLFKKNCANWTDAEKMQYMNVPNDHEDIDDIELESAIELITKINGKPPVE